MDLKRGKIDSTNIEICFFLCLPVEMIKEILYYLSKYDKRNLRPVCKMIESIVNTTICAHSPIMNENSYEKLIIGLNKFPITAFNFKLRFYTKHMTKIFSTLKTKKIFLQILKGSNEPIKIGKDVEELFIFECCDSRKIQWIEPGENLKYLRIDGCQLIFDIIPIKNQIERLDLNFSKTADTQFLKSFCDIFSQLKTIKLFNVFIEMKFFIFPCLQILELKECSWKFKDFDLQPFYNIEQFSMIDCYYSNSNSSIKMWDFSKFLQLRNLEIYRADGGEMLLPPNVRHLSLFTKNEKILYTSKLSPLIESLSYCSSKGGVIPIVEFDQFPPNLRKIDVYIPFNILEEIEAHYRINWQRKLGLSLFNYHDLSYDQTLFCRNNFIIL